MPLVLSPRMVLVPQEGKKGGAASAGGGKKLEELQAMVAEGLVSHLHKVVQRNEAQLLQEEKHEEQWRRRAAKERKRNTQKRRHRQQKQQQQQEQPPWQETTLPASQNDIGSTSSSSSHETENENEFELDNPVDKLAPSAPNNSNCAPTLGPGANPRRRAARDVRRRPTSSATSSRRRSWPQFDRHRALPGA